jgi:hypothetical protein
MHHAAGKHGLSPLVVLILTVIAFGLLAVIEVTAA